MDICTTYYGEEIKWDSGYYGGTHNKLYHERYLIAFNICAILLRNYSICLNIVAWYFAVIKKGMKNDEYLHSIGYNVRTIYFRAIRPWVT